MRTAICLVAVLAVACVPAATRGTMPPALPDGSIDFERAPDFIAIAGETGIAGYARKECFIGNPPPVATRACAVYAEDLRTQLGQIVPGKGFVPLGDPNLVSPVPGSAAPSASNP